VQAVCVAAAFTLTPVPQRQRRLVRAGLYRVSAWLHSAVIWRASVSSGHSCFICAGCAAAAPSNASMLYTLARMPLVGGTVGKASPFVMSRILKPDASIVFSGRLRVALQRARQQWLKRACAFTAPSLGGVVVTASACVCACACALRLKIIGAARPFRVLQQNA
jgi:hypothetical protein